MNVSRPAAVSPPNPKKRKWIIILILGITILFIWGNSLLSKDTSKENSDAVKILLEKIFGYQSALAQFLQTYVRKIAHFLEYGLLGVEAVIATILYRRLQLQGLINCFCLGLFVAVSDESIQIVSGRGSMVQDILLDLCGFLCFAGIALGLTLMFRKKRLPNAAPEPNRSDESEGSAHGA